MENDAFISAILTNPVDPVPRLIYADWLEERGDVRGEFIRLQEEMSRLPAYTDRYWELKPRRNELREQIDPLWLERLGYASIYRPLFSQLPAGRAERWRLVTEFMEYWHKPLDAESGNMEAELIGAEAELGFRLPAALREWYSLAGKRLKVWSRQDSLIPLSHLRFDNDCNALIFRFENQACERWGVLAADLGNDDPPVHTFEEPGIDSPTVTAFAIQTLLLETLWQAYFATNDGGTPSEQILSALPEFKLCDLPNTYWVMNPVYFYEGPDIFLIDSEGDGILYLTARNETAYERLSPEIRSHLEHR